MNLDSMNTTGRIVPWEPKENVEDKKDSSLSWKLQGNPFVNVSSSFFEVVVFLATVFHISVNLRVYLV